MKKMTKREKFELLLTIGEVVENTILVEFINHELELLDRKSASSKDGIRKPTKAQLENKNLQDLIFQTMEDNKAYTISDLQAEIVELEGLSNQKVSSLLKKLVDTELLTKFQEKKKTFFLKSVDKE